jgi:hypothetical protein
LLHHQSASRNKDGSLARAFVALTASNIHRGAHALAARSTDAYEAAREKVCRFAQRHRFHARRDRSNQSRCPIQVADACTVKGLGWTDPTVWEAAERKGLKIGVQDMQGARMLLNRKRAISVSTSRVPAWFRIAGVCVAAVTVLFLMWPGARTSEEE